MIILLKGDKMEDLGHNPDLDIRKVIYDCIDVRVNVGEPDLDVRLIINQNGFLGMIETKQQEDGTFKYGGTLNQTSLQFLPNNFGIVVCDSFDECIKALTDMHVSLFHNESKRLKKLESKIES